MMNRHPRRTLAAMLMIAAVSLGSTGAASSAPSVFRGTMAEMTYVELEKAARSGAIALWALGAIEEHGPHLPLATDVYVPSAQLLQVQQTLAQRNIGSVIVPAYYWGVNRVTGSFPGSIDIRPEVMTELMSDVFRSLARAGFKQVYCITGHYDADHSRAIIAAVQRANGASDIKAHYVLPRSIADRLKLEADPGLIPVDLSFGPPPARPDLHAGDVETSMILSVAPDLVRKEVMSSLKPTDLTSQDISAWRKGYEDAKRLTPLGYLGDPARADAARGSDLIKGQSAAFANAIATSVNRR